MLKINNLSYQYSGQSELNFPDFEIDQGSSLLILGDSGSGKTTLLHLLSGILKPQKGEIFINSQNISLLNNKDLDQFRAKNVGIIFQQPHFLRSLSVSENLRFIQKISKQKTNYNFVNELLNKVGLDHRKDHKPNKLSVGEKQRLNILRAVITKPKLILADEPTSALDDNNCNKVLDLIMNLVNEVNASFVLVTHDNRLKDRFHKKIILE